MPFKVTSASIEDVKFIETKVWGDNRGGFAELFKHSEFKSLGMGIDPAQMSISMNAKHTLRGMHYQMHPKAQGKLVIALEGEIWDVVVDIRKSSPTYGQWISVNLSSDKLNMIWIPIGFAHGFCVLSPIAKVLYFTTDEYAPDTERAIAWNDPDINIKWPIKEPILSDKDQKQPLLKDAENNFV